MLISNTELALYSRLRLGERLLRGPLLRRAVVVEEVAPGGKGRAGGVREARARAGGVWRRARAAAGALLPRARKTRRGWGRGRRAGRRGRRGGALGAALERPRHRLVALLHVRERHLVVVVVAVHEVLPHRDDAEDDDDRQEDVRVLLPLRRRLCGGRGGGELVAHWLHGAKCCTCTGARGRRGGTPPQKIWRTDGVLHGVEPHAAEGAEALRPQRRREHRSSGRELSVSRPTANLPL